MATTRGGVPYKLLVLPLVSLAVILLIFWPAAPHAPFPKGEGEFNQKRAVQEVKDVRDGGAPLKDAPQRPAGDRKLPSGGRHEDVAHEDAVKHAATHDDAGIPNTKKELQFHDDAHKEAQTANDADVDCFYVVPRASTDTQCGGYYKRTEEMLNGKPVYRRGTGAWWRTEGFLGFSRNGRWIVATSHKYLEDDYALMRSLDSPAWPHLSQGWEENVPLSDMRIESRHGECHDVPPMPATAKPDNRIEAVNGTHFLADYALSEMKDQPSAYAYPVNRRFTYAYDISPQVPHALIAHMPKVVFFPGLVSDEDCKAIIDIAHDHVERSRVVDAGAGKRPNKDKVDNVRTSSQTWLDARHLPVKRLMDAIFAVTGFKRTDAEALQVLKYEEGQKYNAHVDYFSADRYGKIDQNRAVTCFIYLNDVEEGGWTWFPHGNGETMQGKTLISCKGGLRTVPRRGNVACFYDMRPDGSLDENSLHAGCPVLKGEKWGGTLWLHKETP